MFLYISCIYSLLWYTYMWIWIYVLFKWHIWVFSVLILTIWCSLCLFNACVFSLVWGSVSVLTYLEIFVALTSGPSPSYVLIYVCDFFSFSFLIWYRYVWLYMLEEFCDLSKSYGDSWPKTQYPWQFRDGKHAEGLLGTCWLNLVGLG